MRNHIGIVTHQQISHTVVLLQTVEQVQDFRLYRHIQRRSGFIEQQDFWPQQQCTGNRHALALAA